MQLYLENNANDIREIAVEIYQLDGRKVRAQQTFDVYQGEQQVHLDIQGLHPGLYLVRIMHPKSGVESVERLVVE